MTERLRAPSATSGSRGAVAAAHPLAVDAGIEAFTHGGSAVDAAIAAQAAIAVVLPDAAGLGGDALALVWDRPGPVTAVNGTGPWAAGGTAVSPTGGSAVTVPGLVDGWLALHARFGRLDLTQVLAPAIRLAADGIDVDPSVVAAAEAQRSRLLAGGAGGWPLLRLRPGVRWRQPELAALLDGVGREGRRAFYEGRAAEAVSRAVRRTGGLLTPDDLESSGPLVGDPVTTTWDGGALHVQPPMSQGVLLAMAAAWLEEHVPSLARLPTDDVEHALVEVTGAAFAHRDDCLRGAELLAEPLDVDRVRASRRSGPRGYLHTAGVAAADARGQVVSSLISVFDEFGSGVFVPELGIILNNRAAGFTQGRNQPAPGARPVHTLAPALLRSADGSLLALATPGADGQVQTLLQVLVRLRRGQDLADAVAAPRWRSENGRLLVERSHPGAEGLATRGHVVQLHPDGADLFGGVVAAGLQILTGHDASNGSGAPFAVGDWRRTVNARATEVPA